MGVKAASCWRRWVCAGVLLSTLHSVQAGVLVSDMLELARHDKRAVQCGVNQRLWEASERGSSQEIARTLLEGAEVDSMGPGLWTALHFAARHLPATCCVSHATRENPRRTPLLSWCLSTLELS